MSVEGLRFFITGGAAGMGAATARAAVAGGASVIVADVRGQSSGAPPTRIVERVDHQRRLGWSVRGLPFAARLWLVDGGALAWWNTIDMLDFPEG